MMIKTVATLALLLSGSLFAAAQENGGFVWIRFHRVQLRNGNCLEGDLVSKNERAVTLKMPAGEMIIRNDQIDRIEFVKIKSWKEPVLVLAKKTPAELRKTPAEAAPEAAAKPAAAAENLSPVDNAEPVPSSISAQIVESVDQAIDIWKSHAGKSRLDLSETLIALGPDAAPYLEFLLLNRTRRTPLNEVAGALATIAEDRFTDLSTRMMSAKFGEVRTAAVIGLAKTKSSQRLPILLQALDDQDASVWRAAFDSILAGAREDYEKRDLCDILAAKIRTSRNKLPLALGLARLGGRDAHSALWDLVGEVDEANRQIGLHALGILGNPEDGPRVQGLLRDASNTIQKAACLTIGKFKYAPAVPDLINLLSDQNEGLQKNARWALGEITGQPVENTSAAWIQWWDNFGSRETRFK